MNALWGDGKFAGVASCPLLSTLSAGAGARRTLHPLHLHLRHLLPHTLQAAGGRGARRLRGAARGGGGQGPVTTGKQREVAPGGGHLGIGRRSRRPTSPRAFIPLLSVANCPHSLSQDGPLDVFYLYSSNYRCAATDDTSTTASTPSSSGWRRSQKNRTLPGALRTQVFPLRYLR